jgi:hypothetical protein
VYVASNVENLHFLVEKQLKNIDDEIRICKHYIRHGYKKKQDTSTFNMYRYLANNPHEIDNIFQKINACNWNIAQINVSDVALHYIHNYKTEKVNVFSSSKFVQEYISDEQVNADKKLSLENACVYFVNNYVKSKQVRYYTSIRYKMGVFFSQRVKDTLRTMPMSISKCFITFPII